MRILNFSLGSIGLFWNLQQIKKNEPYLTCSRVLWDGISFFKNRRLKSNIMTYVDLHKSLPELESTWDFKKNAAHYERLTKSERFHFLEKSAPLSVGTCLETTGSAPLVRGKVCFGVRNYGVGKRREDRSAAGSLHSSESWWSFSKWKGQDVWA